MKRIERLAEKKRLELWIKEGFKNKNRPLYENKDKRCNKSVTEQLAIIAYRKSKERKRCLSFAGLAIRQIRYIGVMVWLLQATLFLAIMVIYHIFFPSIDGAVDPFYYRWFRVYLCMAGLVSAWSSVPFLFRSYRWKMEETEAATRYSLFYLRFVQLLLIGGGTIVMMTGIGTLTIIQNMAGQGEVAANLVFPFLCLGCCILYFVRKEKPEQLFRISSIVGVVLLIAYVLWNRIIQLNGNQYRTDWAWVLCACMLFICICQIWLWKREEEKRWNLV